MSNATFNHEQISVTEYADGSAAVRHGRIDEVTRRVVEQELMRLEQPNDDPFTAAEMLLIGAAELLARRLGLEHPLPF